MVRKVILAIYALAFLAAHTEEDQRGPDPWIWQSGFENGAEIFVGRWSAMTSHLHGVSEKIS